MVTTLPREDIWGDVGRGFGKGASEGYMGRADELAIQKAVQELGPNPSPRDILNAVTNTKTYSPESKQNVFKNYLGVGEYEQMQRKLDIEQGKIKAKEEADALKRETERTQVRELVKQIPNATPEQIESWGESLSLKGAENMLAKSLNPKAAPQSTFQRKYEEEMAKDYVSLAKELPELRTVKSNLADLQKLSDQVGFFDSAKGLVGLSGPVKEMEGMSFPLIKSIVKIFNPSGPLAQKKLEQISKKYVIEPKDLPAVRTAKIKALGRFNDQAIHRAEEKLALYQKYNGAPPIGVLENFDKESDTISDAMLDYNIEAEETDLGVAPEEWKGQTIEGPDGQEYYSDGMRWIKR